MASNLVVDLPDVVQDYILYCDKNRLLHQLSDGSYVAIVTTNSLVVTVYHSPDKVTWTSRCTFSVDSWGANPYGGARPLAACIASNNDIHIMWLNATWVGRYVKLTYTAGTPTWAAGAQENGIAAAGGGFRNEAPAIEILDSGVIVQACLRDPATGSADLSLRIRCRNSAAAWGTEQNIVLGASGPFERVPISLQIARDAGGNVAGVQKVWVMACGGASTVWTHRVAAVTLTTGNFTLTTPPTPIAMQGAWSWGQVFSVAADKWWFIGYTNTGNGTIYAAEASSTVVTTSMSKSMTGNALTVPLDVTIPPSAKMTAIYLPDRMILACLPTTGGVSGVPTVTLHTVYYTTGVFDTIKEARTTTPVTGLANAVDNAGVYIVGGDVNRNQSGTEHCVLVYDTSTDTIRAVTLDAPVQTGSPVLTPAAASTVNTDIPTLSRTLVPAGTKIEWALAEDAAFSVNVKSVVEPLTTPNPIFPYTPIPNIATTVTTHDEVVPTASMLRQLLWYMRSRLVDIIGQTSAWIATQSFTVSHPPTGGVSYPTANQVRPYNGGSVLHRLSFSDTSPPDVQTAYQIIVERNSDGALIVDTGKVLAASNGGPGYENLTEVYLTIPAIYKDVTLRWKVRVWDSDDVVSTSYSAYHLYSVSDAPTVVINSPADAGTITSPAPQITWTPTIAGGRTQASYLVEITRVSDGVQVHSSGTVFSSATSYQVPQAVLVLGVQYQVSVRIYDSSYTTGQGQDINTATATWTPPAQPTTPAASAAAYDVNGYVSITWANTPRDTDFFGWRVYRRVQGDTSAGELLFDTTVATTNSFQDWTAKSGVAYQYNVVQVANRFGTLVESNANWLVAVTGTSTYYWLIHPDDATKNIKLMQIIQDDYSDEYETETFNLIGRGRKVDYGTHFGLKGTLVSQIRNTPTLTARQVKQQLEAIKAELRELQLRTPFGDLYQVAIGDLQVSRLAGVGSNEYVTVSVPYQEVS